MKHALSLRQQIEENFRGVDGSPEFGGESLWLTFYLWGPPESLQRLAATLDSDAWVNTSGWEGAFLYPKVLAKKAATDVIGIAERAERLCDEHGVGILIIDADISAEIGQERPVVTLYRNPA